MRASPAECKAGLHLGGAHRSIQAAVVGGAYLPEGRALARSLFMRRARRSRSQGSVLFGRLASSPPAECKAALPVGDPRLLPSARRDSTWAALIGSPQAAVVGGAYLPEGRALARSLFTRRARRSRSQAIPGVSSGPCCGRRVRRRRRGSCRGR